MGTEDDRINGGVCLCEALVRVISQFQSNLRNREYKGCLVLITGISHEYMAPTSLRPEPWRSKVSLYPVQDCHVDVIGGNHPHLDRNDMVIYKGHDVGSQKCFETQLGVLIGLLLLEDSNQKLVANGNSLGAGTHPRRIRGNRAACRP